MLGGTLGSLATVRATACTRSVMKASSRRTRRSIRDAAPASLEPAPPPFPRPLRDRRQQRGGQPADETNGADAPDVGDLPRASEST